MRFSPVLLAVIAATATLGWVHPAEAQTSELEGAESVGDLEASELEGVVAAIPATVEETGQSATGDQSVGLDLNPNLDVELDLGLDATPDNLGQASPDVQPQRQQSSLTWGNQPTLDTLSGTSPIAESTYPRVEFLSQTLEQVPSSSPDPNAPDSTGQPAPDQPSDQDNLDDPTDDADDDADVPPSTDPEATPEFGVDENIQLDDITEPSAPAAPTTPGTPQPGTPSQPGTPQEEARVLVSEVVVEGAEGELQDIVYEAIGTQPGRTTTRSQLQEDINAIFATGFFSNVRAVPVDTPLGVRITYEVTPNPVLDSVQLSGIVLETITYEGEDVPIQQAVDQIFGNQYGEILNLRGLQGGVEQLNQLYQENGYVLAQVIGAPQISPNGVVTLEVAEGVIEDIEIRFLSRDGEEVDEDGNPIEGRTRDFIITREFDSQPGDVFNQNQIQADLQRAFGLGIFEDLSISLDPGQDPRRVDVVVNVTERNTGSFAAGVGISSASGLFGTASLQEQNLGGNNQRLNAEVQLGQRDLLFDISFTDPWIGGDPNRTSYTINAFGRQSRSLVFEAADDEIRLPNGDRPRIQRFGGGVVFGRPLGDGWRASVGLDYQQVSVRDLDGELTPRTEFGTFASFDESGIDDLTTLEFAVSRDLRNNLLQPTSGSFLRFSTEQSIPLGNGSIFLNRLRASYSYFIPVQFADFTPGCRLDNPTPSDCPQTIALNVQGGTVLGDLPPYEAFSLGGTDSVRGYGPGDVSSSRSFVQATVEYRFPVFSIVSGALFADVGTDLGTQDEVPGEPGIILDKPGFGFGYGLGVRVQSPLGQIRIDYAINDDGDDRIHFGIGERF